jgi:hypothetical protein
MSFDTYLSALKSVIEPKTDSTLAIEFFTRLDPALRGRIEILGRDMLPTNRQEMVALAQRVWHGIVQAGEVKQSNRDQDNNRSSTSCSRGTYRGRGRGGFQDRGRGDRNRGSKDFRGRGRGRGTWISYIPREENKYPSGQNDKGESCCFKCGSTQHYVSDCNGSRLVKKEKDNILFRFSKDSTLFRSKDNTPFRLRVQQTYT